MIRPESQTNEFKSSWQDEYYEWLSGFANTKGGTLFVGVNDDGYVVGVKNRRNLLDTLPNQINSLLDMTATVDYGNVETLGCNLKYDDVPADVASKPENLYVRGILTEKVLMDIDADPTNTTDVTDDVQRLFDAAPGFVKQLRRSRDYREKVHESLLKWQTEIPIFRNLDGSLDYIWIAVDAVSFGVAYHGRYYKRSGGTTREMKGQELSHFLIDLVGEKWDGRPFKYFSLEKIDQEAMRYLRRNAVEKGRLTESQAIVSDQVLLENMNLVTKEGEYTRAAAMLFGNPNKVNVGAYIKIGYFAKLESSGKSVSYELVYQDCVQGPLILQGEMTVNVLYTKYMKALIDYEGIRRIELYMIPQKAMREIILNAIAHKEYRSSRPVQIKVFDDHITVVNDGNWPFEKFPVEEAYEMEHPSYSSNPLIAAGLFMAGEIETWGQGFYKIKKSCDDAGVPLPEIMATQDSVTVTIRASEKYMSILNKISNEQRNQKEASIKDRMVNYYLMKEKLEKELKALEVKRTRPIVQYFEKNDEITAEKAAELIGMDVRTATRYLRKMISLDVIEKIGGSYNTVYRMKRVNQEKLE